MFGSKRKDQKWFKITFYQKKICLKHFILYNSALKGPNLLSNTYFGNLLFTFLLSRFYAAQHTLNTLNTLRRV